MLSTSQGSRVRRRSVVHPRLQLCMLQTVGQRVLVYDRQGFGYSRMDMSNAPTVYAHMPRCHLSQCFPSRLFHLLMQAPHFQHHVLRNVLDIVCRISKAQGLSNGGCTHFAGYMYELFLCHSIYITKKQPEIKQEKAFFQENVWIESYIGSNHDDLSQRGAIKNRPDSLTNTGRACVSLPTR